MKTYGVSRSTTASPEKVWSVWRDPNNWSRWNSGISSAQADGPIANGTKGKMTTNRGSWHDVTFSNLVEERGFDMSMAGPPMTTFTFSCTITPDGTGSKIAQSVAISGRLRRFSVR
ncbi:MAG TPA: SRPBCC family protein [Candidatus Cybelea sp.]|nr:SRPBCC family protein [Candidatus Cybelea sp.]